MDAQAVMDRAATKQMPHPAACIRMEIKKP